MKEFDLAKEWKRPLTKTELTLLKQLAQEFDTAQVAWMMRRYLADRVYPSLKDFVKNFRAQAEDLPEELVCRALLHPSPRVRELGYQLNELSARWFDDDGTGQYIANLEQLLAGILR